MSSTQTGLDAGSPDPRRRLRIRVGIALGVLAWLGGLAWGLQKIQDYSSTPGIAAKAPSNWPGSALVSPRAGRATLVMFMHPQCSCTRASLEELRTILDKAGVVKAGLDTAGVDEARGKISAWVVVLQPPGMSEEWAHSETWETAREMPGVTVVTDAKGTEADRFGALTSGYTVVYDTAGHLVFTGGITGARGHVGDNAGRERVVNFIETGHSEGSGHEVYGCGLHDPHPRHDAEAPAPL
jgi:hypothetical protein